jgi:hypothetical protein
MVAFGLEDGVTAEAEMTATPQIGFDRVGVAHQQAVHQRGHAGTAKSFGSRTRL